MDGHTDSQRETIMHYHYHVLGTITPHYYPVAGYKDGFINFRASMVRS